MKRFGKAKTHLFKQEARLTPGDRLELDKFKTFLGDHKMELPELMEKHGEYMGFTPEEIKKHTA